NTMSQIPQSPSECKSTNDPAMREFLLGALRCARLRASLLANEINALEIAVSRDMVSINAAYEWLDELDAWPFLGPELGRAAACRLLSIREPLVRRTYAPSNKKQTPLTPN